MISLGSTAWLDVGYHHILNETPIISKILDQIPLVSKIECTYDDKI